MSENVQPKELTKKERLFLKAYLDPSNPTTFLHKTNSAKAGGYDTELQKSFAEIGCQVAKRLKVHIDWWLDDNGYSEERIIHKFLALMEAKETKFFQKDGMITDFVDVDALGIQQKAASELALIRNMKISRHEHTGADGGPIEVKDAMNLDALESSILKDRASETIKDVEEDALRANDN